MVATAEGQELIREHLGPAEGGRFGKSVAALADLDGDGVREYAVGDPGDGTRAGTVDVFSGATGASLFVVQGSESGTFGVAIGDAGDANLDGISDLFVGDPAFDDPNQTFQHEGAVRVYSGTNGSLIDELFGDADECSLGIDVAGLDDIDGDGIPELLVGSIDYDEDNYPFFNKRASAIAGGDGSLIYTIEMDYGIGPFRVGVDRDGDGVRDLLIVEHPAPTTHGGGGDLLHVYSGATAVPLIVGWRRYGVLDTLAETGDLDGDGEPDVLVGLAFWHDTSGGGGFTGGYWTFEVEVTSVATQTKLRSHGGYFADTLGDMDGDGIDDYILGGGGAPVTLVSGRGGDVLYAFAPPSGTFWRGSSTDDVRCIGDVDVDGLFDFVVADAEFVDAAGVQRGRALLRASNELWVNAEPKSAAENELATLTTRGVPAGNLIGVAVVDVSGTPFFQFLTLGPADSTEALILSSTVPPGLSSLTATFQGFAIGRNGRVVDSATETIVFL